MSDDAIIARQAREIDGLKQMIKDLERKDERVQRLIDCAYEVVEVCGSLDIEPNVHDDWCDSNDFPDEGPNGELVRVWAHCNCSCKDLDNLRLAVKAFQDG